MSHLVDYFLTTERKCAKIVSNNIVQNRVTALR